MSGRDCDCCFDNVPGTDGICCPGKAHFFCKACVGNFLESFKTADYADQKNLGCRVGPHHVQNDLFETVGCAASQEGQRTSIVPHEGVKCCRAVVSSFLPVFIQRIQTRHSATLCSQQWCLRTVNDELLLTGDAVQVSGHV